MSVTVTSENIPPVADDDDADDRRGHGRVGQRARRRHGRRRRHAERDDAGADGGQRHGLLHRGRRLHVHAGAELQRAGLLRLHGLGRARQVRHRHGHVTVTPANDAPVAVDDSLTVAEDVTGPGRRAAQRLRRRGRRPLRHGLDERRPRNRLLPAGRDVHLRPGRRTTPVPTPSPTRSPTGTVARTPAPSRSPSRPRTTRRSPTTTTLTTQMDTPASVNVLAGDLDVDGDTLVDRRRLLERSPRTARSAATRRPGSARTRRTRATSASDSFTYTVTDGLATDEGLVSVTVDELNVQPELRERQAVRDEALAAGAPARPRQALGRDRSRRRSARVRDHRRHPGREDQEGQRQGRREARRQARVRKARPDQASGRARSGQERARLPHRLQGLRRSRWELHGRGEGRRPREEAQGSPSRTPSRSTRSAS